MFRIEKKKPRRLGIDDLVIKDAWNALGWQIKQDAAEVFGRANYFPVRKDMLEDAIGYRAASVTDPWTGITGFSEQNQKRLRDAATFMLGKNAFKWLKQGENVVTDAVSYAKTTIVVRSVEVAYDNMISNFGHMAMHGMGPIAIAKGTIEKFTEITQYTRNQDEIFEITAELAADHTNPVKTKKLKAREQALRDANKALSIWPLIEAGEFSTISESLTEADIAIREGQFSEYMEKAANYLPGPLKTVGKNLLITKDTALFQGLNRMVQYGDFVSKAVLYDHLARKKRQSHEEIMDVLSEEFVNYNRLPGRGRDFVESIGLLWFYNYKLRITKIALKMLRDKPVSTLFISGGLAPVLDIDTVMSGNIVGTVADGSAGYSVGSRMGWNACW